MQKGANFKSKGNSKENKSEFNNRKFSKLDQMFISNDE